MFDRFNGDMMKRFMIMTALTGMILSCCVTGCKEKLHADPPVLEGDELIIATALRRHMYNHGDKYERDYKYIFISVFGEDPDRDFLDFFSDLFAVVMGGSEMTETRTGFENLPQTKGVWVRFEVIDFIPASEQEAWVTCQTYEFAWEGPSVKYRMQLIDGQWKATSIAQIGSERILQ